MSKQYKIFCPNCDHPVQVIEQGASLPLDIAEWRKVRHIIRQVIAEDVRFDTQKPTDESVFYKAFMEAVAAASQHREAKEAQFRSCQHCDAGDCNDYSGGRCC